MNTLLPEVMDSPKVADFLCSLCCCKICCWFPFFYLFSLALNVCTLCACGNSLYLLRWLEMYLFVFIPCFFSPSLPLGEYDRVPHHLLISNAAINSTENQTNKESEKFFFSTWTWQTLPLRRIPCSLSERRLEGE